MVVLWYSLNVGWNLSNKNLCNRLKLPMTATFMQCTLGTFFMIMTWVMKLRPVPRGQLWADRQASLSAADICATYSSDEREHPQAAALHRT